MYPYNLFISKKYYLYLLFILIISLKSFKNLKTIDDYFYLIFYTIYIILDFLKNDKK